MFRLISGLIMPFSANSKLGIQMQSKSGLRTCRPNWRRKKPLRTPQRKEIGNGYRVVDPVWNSCSSQIG